MLFLRPFINQSEFINFMNFMNFTSLSLSLSLSSSLSLSLSLSLSPSLPPSLSLSYLSLPVYIFPSTFLSLSFLLSLLSLSFSLAHLMAFSSLFSKHLCMIITFMAPYLPQFSAIKHKIHFFGIVLNKFALYLVQI